MVSGQAAGAKEAPSCVRSTEGTPDGMAAAPGSPALPAPASAAAVMLAWRHLRWSQLLCSASLRRVPLRAGA